MLMRIKKWTLFLKNKKNEMIRVKMQKSMLLKNNKKRSLRSKQVSHALKSTLSNNKSQEDILKVNKSLIIN